MFILPARKSCFVMLMLACMEVPPIVALELPSDDVNFKRFDASSRLAHAPMYSSLFLIILFGANAALNIVSGEITFCMVIALSISQ